MVEYPLKEEFPKKSRLLNRRDFSRVHHHHSTFSHGQFLVSYRINKKSASRLGIVLTRKNGPSVRRNLCKRWFRELFRRSLNKSLLSQSVQYDIVVRIRGLLVTVTFEQAAEAFQLLQKKLHVT